MRVRNWLRKNGHLLMFLLPGLILYSVFMAYPLLTSLSYSLYDWRGLLRLDFIGLENFITVLTRWPYNERFWNALGHNAIFFAVTFTIQSTLGLAVRSEEHTSELQSRGHIVCR